MNRRNIIWNLLLGLTISFILIAVACERATPIKPIPESPIIVPPPANESPPLEKPPPAEQTSNGDQWVLIDKYSGETDETIPAFHISGIKWRITWTVDARNPEYATLILIVYQDNEIPIKEISLSADNQSNNSDIIDIGSGDYSIKVIASNLNEWHITIEDHSIKDIISPIQITHIHYKGRSSLESILGNHNIAEADEYIEIKNTSDVPQKLSGWKIKNISSGIPAYYFSGSASRQYNSWFSANIKSGYPSFPPPGHTPYSSAKQMKDALKGSESPGKPFSPNTLAPYTSIRVYTGEYHLESGGFTFYYHPGDIWNNDKPDTAVLYNPKGEEVSRRSYTISDI
jgi:hypothetical protein